MHKTRLEDDLKTLTFGFMHLFYTMHLGGAMMTSTMTYFSPFDTYKNFPSGLKSKVKFKVAGRVYNVGNCT